MAATIATLPTRKPVARKPVARKPKTLMQWVATQRPETLGGYGLLSVATGLTGLSLTDLAHGTELVTGLHGWQPWAMAFGIDCGFVSLEVAGQISPQAAPRVRMIGCVLVLILSAVMNGMAFSEHATNVVFAWLLGIIIPVLIFGLVHVASHMLRKH